MIRRLSKQILVMVVAARGSDAAEQRRMYTFARRCTCPESGHRAEPPELLGRLVDFTEAAKRSTVGP